MHVTCWLLCPAVRTPLFLLFLQPGVVLAIQSCILGALRHSPTSLPLLSLWGRSSMVLTDLSPSANVPISSPDRKFPLLPLHRQYSLSLPCPIKTACDTHVSPIHMKAVFFFNHSWHYGKFQTGSEPHTPPYHTPSPAFLALFSPILSLARARLLPAEPFASTMAMTLPLQASTCPL